METFDWEHKNGRCLICGAKMEVHDEEHCCRFHRDEYIGQCDVCGNIKVPKPPIPPLCRYIEPFLIPDCPICKSSSKRIGLFTKQCINPKCRVVFKCDIFGNKPRRIFAFNN